MRRGRIIFFTILCTALFSQACEEYTIEKPIVQEEIKFSQDVMPIFTNSCIGCHKGSVNPDLRSDKAYNSLTTGGYYNLEEPDKSKIYIKLTTSSTHMSLASEVEKAKVLQWITLGAKND